MGKNLFVWYFVKQEASFIGMGDFFAKIIFFWGIVFAFQYIISDVTGIHGVAALGMGVIVFGVAFALQFKVDYLKNDEKMIVAEFIGDRPGMIILKKLILNEKVSCR